MKRKLAYQVCYAIAAIWALPNAANAAGIATVVDVVNEGYRTPPGADETAAKSADELVQNEALRTEKELVIQVKFVDGSELSVEQSSEMVLSDYVFDGSAASGMINLNNGLFHFKSNGNDDQGVKLRTPVATIGVRGTEFLVHVDGDDVTIVDILSGGVSATPHGSGKEITCYEGQSILIAGENEDAQCGDIGSFSTAAGPAAGNEGTAAGPAAATATRRSGGAACVSAASVSPPPAAATDDNPRRRAANAATATARPTDECATTRVHCHVQGRLPHEQAPDEPTRQSQQRPSRGLQAGWRLRPERLDLKECRRRPMQVAACSHDVELAAGGGISPPVVVFCDVPVTDATPA